MKLPNGYGSVVKMSGKRRKPYMVRKTIGWHLDKGKGRQIQDFIIIGYAETRAEGLKMLAEYNQNPYDVDTAKVTFAEVYERWSKSKYPTISHSNVKGYEASYKVCGFLYDKAFREIKLCDLQLVIETCGKNYPTLKKLKGLFNQMYAYAMKNDICNKDYSQFVDLAGYRDKNPNRRDRNIFTKEELATLWAHKANPYCQILLMLNYNACRISEFLDLKKENVHLEKQYFDVVESKTENGIRKGAHCRQDAAFLQRMDGALPLRVSALHHRRQAPGLLQLLRHLLGPFDGRIRYEAQASRHSTHLYFHDG